MNLQAIWQSCLGSELATQGQNYEILQALLDMLNLYEETAQEYFYQEEEFYSEEFSDWLYDTSVIELNDLKRELQLALRKCQGMEKNDTRLTENSCKVLVKENPFFLISLHEEELLCAYTVQKLYTIKRGYLKVLSKSEFKKNYEECFPNIYFAESVPASINNLKTNFKLISAEIVDHLSFLNSYYKTFETMRRNGCSNKCMADSFKEYSGIECSPQNDRKEVKVLEREYYNTLTMKHERICCELHTKFKRRGKEAQKQDRIYFSAGKDGIKGGKIIVIHIGRHIKNGKL